jgi:hypothetical protein
MGGQTAGNRSASIRHGAPVKATGFAQIRRGIWEHLRDGRLTLSDVAVYTYIISQADTRTGIWQGSAGALAGELSISPRLARRFLERLSRGDYIKRFPTPGKHVCYPILVHKFLLTNGEHKGEQLNALSSLSPVDLQYFPGEQIGEQMGEHVSSQKRSEKREEIKPPQTASANPLADTLEVETKQAAFDLFWERWPRKQDKTDAKRAWWKVPLAEYPPLMAAIEKFLTCDQWCRGVIPHASTWLNKKRWQDEDIPQGSTGGGSHGHRPNANDAIEITLATMRQQSRPN